MRARSPDAAPGAEPASEPGAGSLPDPAGEPLWGSARLAYLEARALADAPDADHARTVAALLAAALTAPPERAHAALDVLARALARMNAEAEARAVRAARRALGALLPPLAPATPPAE